jgi:lipid II:glycine glycyltransferase (peptidoglycan interpeptide bridge formation enzyme)
MSDIDDDEYIYEGHDGYMIDLSLSEDELYKNLHQKSCRYSINKSKKLGVSIRETMDVENFVDVYYLQLQEVFKKQGLSPTYKKDCVQALVKALYPDHILLLEAVTKDGEIAATGLFPGEKNIAVFWGGASYQKFQNLCPNEPLIWEAIRIWKNRGAKIFDMCGLRPYKLKFGPTLYTKPRIFFAKYRILIFAKRILKRIFYGLRKARAKFSK